MSEKKQMHLIMRGKNDRHGGTYEIWDADGEHGIYVDFNPSPADTGVPETMAFSLDIPDLEVTDWAELAVWYEDATGGKAIRELGYEPVEDGRVLELGGGGKAEEGSQRLHDVEDEFSKRI